jgi:large subunit ribosomal protein L6
MSRIGNKPVQLPTGVTVTVQGDVVEIKGSKGTLTVKLIPGITVEVADNQVVVKRANDEIQTKANHGLVRSLIQNQVIGVTQGYKKTLKLVGTGYRATAKGQGISLALGFSHPVIVDATPGITFTLEGNDTIHIAGIDKHLLGQVAANIRKLRPPEPYKGKGIRYSDEVVRTKPGKTAAK